MAKQTKAEKQAALAAAKDTAPVVNETATATEDSKTGAEETTTTETAPVESKGSPIKNEGKIKNIILMHLAGSTNKQIQEAGFHPTTISIQVNKYKKKAAAFIGKTDEETIAAGFTVEYVNSLDTAIKAKAAAKEAAEKAAADKAAAATAAKPAAEATATV